MRQIVEQLQSFLTALGYPSRVEGALIEVEQRLLDGQATKSKILGGRAQDITEESLREAWPDRVVIEDSPPAEAFQRLQDRCSRFSEPTVVNISRYLDDLWDASRVVQKAMTRAEEAADQGLAESMRRPARPDPRKGYVEQFLTDPEKKSHDAVLYTESWLEGDQAMLGILARAGLGKSELTRVLQWRAGLQYRQRSGDGVPHPVPPVVLRVELRDLRELSVRAMAEFFRDSWGERQLGDEVILRELLIAGRVVLLLDGLDEINLTRDAIADGLIRLGQHARSGAKWVVTSRPGYYGRETPLTNAISEQGVVVHLEPLTEAKSVELVQLTDSALDRSTAETLVKRLPTSQQGVPLILRWTALSHGFTEAESEAQGLLDLLGAFCQRDEERVNLSSPEQMAILKDLAYEIALSGGDSIPRDQAMVLVGSETSAFLDGPHALLLFPDSDAASSGGSVAFLEKTFQGLFLAERVQEVWGEREGAGRLADWLSDFLGQRVLEPLTVEYLAQLVEDDRVTRAWSAASEYPVRAHRMTRRNLLAIALEKVSDTATGRPLRERSETLAGLLGSRDLADTAFIDLTIERFAFDGWRFHNVDPSHGYIAYNDFTGADFDATLRPAEQRRRNNDGLDGGPELDGNARTRLLAIIESFRNHRVSPTALHRHLAENTPGIDIEGLTAIRAAGVVERIRAARSEWVFELTQTGRRAFNKLVRDPDHQDLVIDDLLERLS